MSLEQEKKNLSKDMYVLQEGYLTFLQSQGQEEVIADSMTGVPFHHRSLQPTLGQKHQFQESWFIMFLKGIWAVWFCNIAVSL